MTYEWNAIMKRNLVTSGLVGAFALALTTAATLPALAGNPGNSQQLSASAASSPLILVRGGGGGGHGGGGMGGVVTGRLCWRPRGRRSWFPWRSFPQRLQRFRR